MQYLKENKVEVSLLLKEKIKKINNNILVLSSNLLFINRLELKLNEFSFNAHFQYVETEKDIELFFENNDYSTVIVDYDLFSINQDTFSNLNKKNKSSHFIVTSSQYILNLEFELLNNDIIFSFIENFEINIRSLYVSIKRSLDNYLSNKIFIINSMAIDYYTDSFFNNEKNDKNNIFKNLNYFFDFFKETDHSFKYSVFVVKDDSISNVKNNNIQNSDQILKNTIKDNTDYRFENINTKIISLKNNTRYVFVFENLDSLTFLADRVLNLIITLTSTLISNHLEIESVSDYYLETILSLGINEREVDIISDIALFNDLCNRFELDQKEKDKIFFKCTMIGIKRNNEKSYLDIKNDFIIEEKYKEIIDIFYDIKEGRVNKKDLFN